MSSTYVCKLNGKYLSTLVPYYKDMYLLEKIVIGCTPESITYIFPDYQYFSVTTVDISELHKDDRDNAYASGTKQSEYLKSILNKYPLHSKEHLQCVVNLYYDNVSDEITLHKLVEEK